MGDSKSKTATPTPTPAAETKRRRKSTPKQTDTTKQEPTSSEENGAGWLPKGKNWDNEIEKVETIFKSNEGTLLACLEFINGKKATVEIPVCYEKCPLKVCLHQECKRSIRILNFNQDAQILRIAPVSQLVIASQKQILTFCSVFKNENED
jgi:hypothetical protein